MIGLLWFNYLLFTCLALAFHAKDVVEAPRISNATPSPNGTFAVFTKSAYSVDTDSRLGGVYIICLTSMEPVEPELLIKDPSAASVVWLDDNTLLYISNQGGKASLQTYNMVFRKGRQLLISGGSIESLKSAPCSDDSSVRIAFTAKAKEDGDFADFKNPSDWTVYDRLWTRYWNDETKTKNTIFVAVLRIQESHYFLLESPINMLNLTQELRDLESPIPYLYDPSDCFSISSSHLAFVAKDPELEPAFNTRANVYLIPFSNLTELQQINFVHGGSKTPVFSPNGNLLAYFEQRIARNTQDRKNVRLKS